jgi:Pyruvate/2-oxoacid:ferredoxin oxidoreductase delta subunit
MIDEEEALAILKKADKEGLVLQPSNSQKAANICCCCGCCCGVLRTIKRYPKPTSIVSSAYRAAFDASTCDDCGTCLDRCQMDALRREDGGIALDLDRCIGCGLCVSTCPTHSLTLARKPSSEQPVVPETMMKTYVELARARGKLKPASLLKAWLKARV